MALADLTPQEASQRLLSFLKEDRLIQGAWHKTNGGGRQLACMIGALDPSITDASQCPSGVMPQWLAYCTVSLFDGQSKENALAWAERYAALMSRWHGLEPDAWARIEVRFKIESVKFAISAAEPVCKNKDYWPQVTAAAQQVLDALGGNGNLAAAYTAAYAAYTAARDIAAYTVAYTAANATAYAAYTAAYAAYTAARDTAANAAAYAAANAAYTAAYAAYTAARDIAARDIAAYTAARATANATLASKLLDAVELEVLSAESLAGAN